MVFGPSPLEQLYETPGKQKKMVKFLSKSTVWNAGRGNCLLCNYSRAWHICTFWDCLDPSPSPHVLPTIYHFLRFLSSRQRRLFQQDMRGKYSFCHILKRGLTRKLVDNSIMTSPHLSVSLCVCRSPKNNNHTRPKHATQKMVKKNPL